MRQLIILGGGTSVIEGIDKGLFETIKNKWTIGLNYSHHYFNSTCLMYVDDNFWLYQKYFMEKLPLVIGKESRKVRLSANKIELESNNYYNRDCLGGVYKSTLVGIFALSLAIKILNIGEIYLLGYDYGAKKGEGNQLRAYDKNKKALTHWYQHGNLKSVYTGESQELIHRGIGKVNWYEAMDEIKNPQTKECRRVPRAEKEFQVYENESKVKIYNVSLESNIPTFPKMSYEDFFKRLNKEDLNQDFLRQEMAKTCLDIKKKG